MSALVKKLYGNNHLVVLNLAFNPILKDDPIRRFGNFIRQNPKLMVLNLAGVLQSQQQVLRVVKKAKKSQAIISLNLSHTPMIVQLPKVRNYITQKLQIEEIMAAEVSISPPRKLKRQNQFNFKDPEEIPERLDWKHKYELVARAKAQERDRQYFKHQAYQFKSQTNKQVVLQRTIAHNEIDGNKRWQLSPFCFVTDRWKYSIFALREGEQYVQGSFELLHHVKGSKMQGVDVREFARRLIETSGDVDTDFKVYCAMLPEDVQDDLRPDYEGRQLILKRMKEQDLTLYQDFNLWHSVIRRKLLFKDIQYFPTKPTQFDFDDHVKTHKHGEDPKLRIVCDFMKP